MPNEFSSENWCPWDCSIFSVHVKLKSGVLLSPNHEDYCTNIRNVAIGKFPRCITRREKYFSCMMMRQQLYFAFEEGAPTNPIGSADEVSADPWSTNSSTAVSLLISKTPLPPKIDRKNLLSPITIHQVCCQQLCPHLFPLVLTSLTIKLILLLIESTTVKLILLLIESTMIEFLLIYLQRQIPLMKGLPRTYSFSTNVPDCHRSTEHHFERKRSYCSSHRGWIWGLWDPLDAKISILYVVIKNEVISLQNYVETFNFRIHWFDIVVSTIMKIVLSRKDGFSFWILSN